MNQPETIDPVVETPVQTEPANPIDTSNWKTYRNEEYGFELKYPKTWINEEFASASIGLPVDCKITPKKCKNFSVKFSSPDKIVQPVVFETLKKNSGISVVKNPDAVELPIWEKNIFGHQFTKSNNYFTIFDSCFTTAGIKNVSLKKDVNFYFFTFYEPRGSTVEDVEIYCSKEIPDQVFDKIVGSFTVLP